MRRTEGNKWLVRTFPSCVIVYPSKVYDINSLCDSMLVRQATFGFELPVWSMVVNSNCEVHSNVLQVT